MKKAKRLALFLLSSYLISNGNLLSADFTTLFNGRNLQGWVNVNCAEKTWQVRDGMIICSGKPKGIMRTQRQYQNYILELEWRHTEKGGNAGVFLHSDPLPARGKPFSRAIEVQIMDGNHGDVFSIQGATLTPAKPHPQGWARALPQTDAAKPASEWNHYRIESRDGMVNLEVNGKQATTAFHCNPRKGYICLESEGSEIHFRNIRIMELPGDDPPGELTADLDSGFRSLYNGLDLTGWRAVPGNRGHWQPNDWILEYDGESEAEGDDRHLWTGREFSDFILMADWRLPGEPRPDDVPFVLPDGSTAKDDNGEDIMVAINDAGDSGIYLRGSSKSQVNIWTWPVGSGEIWGYRTDSGQSAAVRRSATPVMNADNAAGEWNRFFITVSGETVTVRLNGKTVIDKARLSGMPKRGPIALQHHGDQVHFANIYIKELKQ